MRKILLLLLAGALARGAVTAERVTIPGGKYTPFFLKVPVDVPSFQMDRDLVTNADFLKFVEQHPEWRKSKVKALFADSHYLEQWKSDLQLASSADRRRPVTRVSWFAARAYCQSQNGELPTTDEWEYALFDQGRNQSQVKKKILAWYGKPNGGKIPSIGSGGGNGFGVRDLSTLVWEWTLDFNSAVGVDTDLVCGGASVGARDSSDYAAFMRFSMRNSLKASYTTSNLGFRCAKEVQP